MRLRTLGFLGILLAIWTAAGTPTPTLRGAADVNKDLTAQAREFFAGEGGNASTAGQVTPIRNPDGTRRGLKPIPKSLLGKARQIIRQARTGPMGPLDGYVRKSFGTAWNDDTNVPFGHNGCKTRDDILKRDLTHLEYRGGSNNCVVTRGVLDDPYTGHKIAFTKGPVSSNDVQIDHVMPLAYLYRMGAAGWSAERRQQIANDPLNLLAVDGPTNEAKGADGAADWMPPNAQEDCAYSVRVAQVSIKYDAPIRSWDKTRMLKACGG